MKDEDQGRKPEAANRCSYDPCFSDQSGLRDGASEWRRVRLEEVLVTKKEEDEKKRKEKERQKALQNKVVYACIGCSKPKGK